MKLHFGIFSIFGSFLLTFLAIKEIEGVQTIQATIQYSGLFGNDDWPGSSTEPKKITVQCDPEKMAKIDAALKDTSGKWKIIWTNPQTSGQIEEEIFTPSIEDSEDQLPLHTLPIQFIQMVGLSHDNSTPLMYGEVVHGRAYKQLQDNNIIFKGDKSTMESLREDLTKHDVWQCLTKMPILPENTTILSPIIHNVVNRLDSGVTTDVFSLTVEIPTSIKMETRDNGYSVEGVVFPRNRQIKLYVKPFERQSYEDFMQHDVNWSGVVYLKYPFDSTSFSGVFVINPKVSQDVQTVASELKDHEVLTVNYEKLDFDVCYI